MGNRRNDETSLSQIIQKPRISEATALKVQQTRRSGAIPTCSM